MPKLPLDNLVVATGEIVKLGQVKGSVSLPYAVGPASVASPLGPAAPGEQDLQKIQIPENENLLFVTLNLTWATVGPTPETSDLDFYVYDASGKLVGQGASLANPEVAKVRLTSKVKLGEWTTRVVDFTNPATDYTITVEGSR